MSEADRDIEEQRTNINAELEYRDGEIARLRKALEFYANPEIYQPHPHGPAFERRDLWHHALAALTMGTGRSSEGET